MDIITLKINVVVKYGTPFDFAESESELVC